MDDYRTLKQAAYEANMQLPALGLVMFTFGNASAADHSRGIFAIKPSGVPYAALAPDQMVIVDFDGKTVQGALRPSSDTKTHAALYKHWPEVGGIAHTHSTYATAWAQALRDIPVLGTTHADYAPADIPCAPPMSEQMVQGDYEWQTGMQIIECLRQRQLTCQDIEMILVGHHAPFTWGKTAEKAVSNSAVLESIARLALLTESINPQATRLSAHLIKKHFERKHGPDSYYGQPTK